MSEPTRIRAAVVVASLAGSSDDAWGAFTPGDAALAARVHARLRAAGDRRRVAEAIVAERLALSRVADHDVSTLRGARFFASWMRSLDTAARARVARGLDESGLARLRAHIRDDHTLDPTHRGAAAWMMAQGARVLRRVPMVGEASTMLAVLRGECDATTVAVVRWERALRVGGRYEGCAAMARSLEGDE